MSIKEQITEDMKSAMRAKDSERLGTIRLLLAACKQKEVDERVTLSDADVVAIIDKLVKAIEQVHANPKTSEKLLAQGVFAREPRFFPARRGLLRLHVCDRASVHQYECAAALQRHSDFFDRLSVRASHHAALSR